MAVIVKRIGYKWVRNSSGSTGGGSTIVARYLRSFDVVNWQAGTGEYTLTVPYALHNTSLNPAVKVYLDNVTSYEEVLVPVRVNLNGDITISVSSTPDNRFKGKIVIL